MSEHHALIIDDNASNLGVLARLLSRQGVSSTEVLNPNQLDAMLPGMPAVDVVFLDLELPGVDGFQLHNQLRSDARFTNVPIVACTVHVSEINAAHRQGFNSFLGKPLNPAKFPEQLARILRGESVWETA